MHKGFIFVFLGLIVGILASFSGLGGGFLMVPLLLFLSYEAQKAVGTSFMAILVISISLFQPYLPIANCEMWIIG